MENYNNTECTVASCILHDMAKHGYNHYYAVNWIKLRLKVECYAIIPASRFAIKDTTEGAPACDVASGAIKTKTVIELTVYVAANIVELFMQTLLVFQMNLLLDSEHLF